MFDSQVSALQSEKDKQTNLAKPKNCELCKKTFQSEAAFQQHLSSKTHAKKIAKKGTGAPSSPAQPPKKAGKVPNVPPLASPTKPSRDSKAEAPVEEAEEEQEEEEEEGEGDEEQGTPIPLKHCLFCSQTFNDIPTTLDHMLKMHGFFIPFIEYLHDLEGLLEYLGAKVGMGKVCLYCNGRGRAAFPTVHAVQQHMTAKQHCKLRFEEDEEDDEFLEFFNFPGMDDEGDEGDDDEGKKEGEEVKKQKHRVVDVLPTGELLVSDGSIIGHRSLVRAYRQHVRPTESRYEVVLSQMTSRSGTYGAFSGGNSSSSALVGSGGNAPGNGALIFAKRQEKLLRKQQRKANKTQVENTRINKLSLRTGVNGNLHRNLRYSAPSLF